MRGTRWLLILAIVAILAGLSATYRIQRKTLASQAPQKPASLPANMAGSLQDWKWSKIDDRGKPVVEIFAKNLKQEKNTSRVQLEQVELHIFNKAGDEYNLVKSASAEFSEVASRLYSEGDVEITLGVPVTGKAAHKLVSIRTSGVTFESKTGKASTDRPASFAFENGDGKAIGASYDPGAKELHLLKQVELNWKAPSPGAKRMKIEAGELTYKEADSVIWLNPWARLTRENAVIDAGPAIVKLRDGAIYHVDAQNGRGVDHYPKRQLEYSADNLAIDFADGSEVEKISGQGHARLVSTSEASVTAMTSDAVDLTFETADNENALKHVMANGNAVVESKPLAAGSAKLPETRVLRCQTIEMQMRAGGREIEVVRTHAAGRLEFLPNQKDQRPRRLDAERMTIAYGAQNQIQSFQATNVETETEPTAEERARRHTVSKTRSKNLSAEFDPRTSQLKRMEQWENFAYEEADRKARAERAVLEQDRDLITLDKAARLWDLSGSTTADKIVLQQKTGDFTAEGHVNSSRLPDKKKKTSEMLSGDEPLQAVAQRMTSANRNRLLHYEGNAVMWQGADRVQAGRIDVDREKRALTAHDAVITQFVEKSSSASAAPSRPPAANLQPPLITTVKAADLIYTEQDRLAHYTGAVDFMRPGLHVKAADLRAYLSESKTGELESKTEENTGSDSRIEKAFADGRVEIVQTAADRTRTGTGEHAEYYTTDERIILRGGQPQLTDTRRGNTRGTELTYFVNDDRLLVSGVPGQRVSSHLRRK